MQRAAHLVKRRWLSWDDVSNSRGALYGLAIIGIMVFHYFEGVVSMPEAVNDLLFTFARAYNAVFGSIGVEVFVLLSGYGIYHSLSGSRNLRRYFAKRAKRVLVPYAILGSLFWFAKDMLVLRLSLLDFAKDLLFVSFLQDGVRTVWYVPFILAMYLIAPLVFRCMERGCFATVVAIAWAVGCMAMSGLAPGLYGHIEIALLRAPAFFVGMDFGRLAVRRQDPPTWALGLTLAALPIKFAASTQSITFQRLANVLYAMLLIAVVVCAFCRTEGRVRPRWLPGMLDAAGRCSFELYLTHVLLRNFMGTVGIDTTNARNYLACIAVSIPAALALQKVCSGGTRRKRRSWAVRKLRDRTKDHRQGTSSERAQKSSIALCKQTVKSSREERT